MMPQLKATRMNKVLSAGGTLPASLPDAPVMVLSC
jgi:hypothetical protein